MSGHQTVIVLIRHALSDGVGARLTSRLPGVHLSADGVAQTRELTARLHGEPFDAIYSGPLERAVETARPLAEDRHRGIDVLEELDEFDFGEWSGQTFADLARLAAWRRFNTARAFAPVPHGESALDVQRRIVAALDGLRRLHRGSMVALVSHAEVIRSAVLHATGTSLNLWRRVAIDPASVTAIAYENGHPRVLTLNERPGRRLNDESP